MMRDRVPLLRAPAPHWWRATLSESGTPEVRVRRRRVWEGLPGLELAVPSQPGEPWEPLHLHRAHWLVARDRQPWLRLPGHDDGRAVALLDPFGNLTLLELQSRRLMPMPNMPRVSLDDIAGVGLGLVGLWTGAERGGRPNPADTALTVFSSRDGAGAPPLSGRVLAQREGAFLLRDREDLCYVVNFRDDMGSPPDPLHIEHPEYSPPVPWRPRLLTGPEAEKATLAARLLWKAAQAPGSPVERDLALRFAIAHRLFHVAAELAHEGGDHARAASLYVLAAETTRDTGERRRHQEMAVGLWREDALQHLNDRHQAMKASGRVSRKIVCDWRRRQQPDVIPYRPPRPNLVSCGDSDHPQRSPDDIWCDLHYQDLVVRKELPFICPGCGKTWTNCDLRKAAPPKRCPLKLCQESWQEIYNRRAAKLGWATGDET